MKIIGLTGSIGMGKSTAAGLLQRLGVRVHDSDATVHHMLTPKGAGFHAVIAMFPSAYDRQKNMIDRKALGQMVFGNDHNRQKLESILHPLVWQSQKRFVVWARRNGIRHIVLDIPLLYETGAEKKCDKVVVVTAPAFIQKQRVLKRPNMTEAKFAAILKQQYPDHEKRRRADFVVQTGLGYAHTLLALKRVLMKM